MGELFSESFTEGNMTAIESISGVIGDIAVFIISIIGFGIVIASLLKNALAGLYVTNPRLWDKVEAVKKEGVQVQEGDRGGNKTLAYLGTGLNFLLALLPNIKAMTDFEEIPENPKTYFMKAIPVMILQIFIGVFIFFGYPAKISQKMAEFGTGMFDILIDNVDPVAWTDSLPDKLVLLSFSTDNSTNPYDKVINDVARAATNKVIGDFSTMTKEARLNLAIQIEEFIINDFDARGVEAYCDPERYNITISTRIEHQAVSLDRVNTGLNEVDGSYSMASRMQITEELTGVPAAQIGEKYVRYDIVFSPIANSSNISSVKCALSGVGYTLNADKKSISIKYTNTDVTGVGLIASSNGSNCTLYFSNGESVSGKMTTANNTITITTNKDLSGVTVSAVEVSGGLKYKDNNSKTHPVVKITLESTYTSSPQAKFTPTDAAGIKAWDYGYSPERANAVQETPKKEETPGAQEPSGGSITD